MEIVLNLVWLLLAVMIVALWLRYAPRKGATRAMQVAALAMLIVMLFPVISVTDDLQTIQNPAELRLDARRNHAALSSHSNFPSVAAHVPPVLANPSFGFLGFVAPTCNLASRGYNPALAPIQNRPPPAA
jgi:hypothetical protein